MLAHPARGAFHLWQIKEVFSNGDGSVQFIEMFTNAPNELFLNAHQMSATSDGVSATVSLNHNLVGPTTANRHFLLATPGFAALPGGVAPDYTLPAQFFDPQAASITINFVSGVDVVSFPGASLPKNGLHSFTDTNVFGAPNLTVGVNSPTNFAGASGSVNLVPEPGSRSLLAAAATCAAWPGALRRRRGPQI